MLAKDKCQEVWHGSQDAVHTEPVNWNGVDGMCRQSCQLVAGVACMHSRYTRRVACAAAVEVTRYQVWGRYEPTLPAPAWCRGMGRASGRSEDVPLGMGVRDNLVCGPFAPLCPRCVTQLAPCCTGPEIKMQYGKDARDQVVADSLQGQDVSQVKSYECGA
jgi:hypothetical protein